MSRIYTTLIGRAENIVESFTHQADKKKLLICKIVHYTVGILAEVSIKVAIAAVISEEIPDVSMEVVSGSRELLTESMKRNLWMKPEKWRTGFGWERGDFQNWWNALTPEEKNIPGLKGVKPLQFSFDPKALLHDNGHDWILSGYRNARDAFADHMDIDQGFTSDILCGAWEGNAKNRNPDNTNKVKANMSKFFELLQRKTRDQFRQMVDGYVPVPGRPTLMALYTMNIKWAGSGSVIKALKNMEPLKS